MMKYYLWIALQTPCFSRSQAQSHTHCQNLEEKFVSLVVLLMASAHKVILQAPVVPSKPQRPPPPSKPAGLGRSEAEPLHTKDKAEVQAHIRSLKENNSALTEINGHLEDKLFKVDSAPCSLPTQSFGLARSVVFKHGFRQKTNSEGFIFTTCGYLNHTEI